MESSETTKVVELSVVKFRYLCFRENYSTVITHVTISPVTKDDQYEIVCFGYDVAGMKITGAIGKIQLSVRGMHPPLGHVKVLYIFYHHHYKNCTAKSR